MIFLFFFFAEEKTDLGSACAAVMRCFFNRASNAIHCTWLQWLGAQQGTTGEHMNDFSINNAPLIIVLLFKGEWQSFLSSRGGRERPACLREGLIYIFGKCTLSPREVRLSFSVNTGSELSLLWRTHRSTQAALRMLNKHAVSKSTNITERGAHRCWYLKILI